MGNGADPRHRDAFTLELRRRLDLGSDNQALHSFVDDAGDHDGITAAQIRINNGIAGGADELDVVCEKRTDARGAGSAHDDNFRINPLLAKEAFLLGHPIRTVKRAHGAEAQPNSILSAGRSAENPAYDQRQTTGKE